MNKRAFGIVAVAALAVAAVAAPVAAASPKTATGDAHYTTAVGNTWHAVFNVQDDAAGPRGTTVDRGTMSVEKLTSTGITPFSITADVICATISGDTAVFQTRVTQTTSPVSHPIGRLDSWRVIDVADSGIGVDTFSSSAPNADSSCGFNTSLPFGPFEVTEGNVQVH